MFYPNLETVKTLAEEYNIIPVMMEYYADMDTPISIFKRMEKEQFCFLLESVEGSRDMARYSFIGRNPFLVFQSYGDTVEVTTHTGRTERYQAKPIEELQALCGRYRAPLLAGLPQFSGGAVGYFAYDIVRQSEFLPNMPQDDLKQPDMHFMFMDEIIAFDHLEQKLMIIVNLHVTDDLAAQYERAAKRIMDIQNELFGQPVRNVRKPIRFRGGEPPKSNTTKEEFCAMVDKAKEYIKNGDIFQVVLSQRFELETDVDPLDAYRAIRLINPSSYMYYLKFDTYQLAGASPELLVRVEGDVVRNSPIAGTKPRGKSYEEDMRLEQELTDDPKENAEHTMLVDLGRNDVGKVCEFGSVKVERLKYIQRFSHVMHMTSDVTGRLRKDKTVFDALRAVLPAGTLSGAPKVRAMQIIDELEKVRRGSYGGAIGYIGFGGTLDSCITIRTALFRDGKAYVQSGGGIVYDSVPETEYQESVNKAAAMLKAIERAGDIAGNLNFPLGRE